ncbi:MAG TPA: 16S rRNA (cytosine(1402)-N(4))-methyltransferase RsmH [Opitutaceae bacterium]|jgi:16S rRNA (cytosine1402-N4)-methyltransferase
MSFGHQPVLLRETLALLGPKPGARFLDCTFGGGGHSRALLESAPEVAVTALDRDPEAGPRAEALAAAFPGKFHFVDRDFGRLADLPAATYDGVLFDLGVSSFQLDDPARGFSFRSEAPLDLRMDTRQGVPGWRWLETATEEMLVRAIRDFGEERHWRRIVMTLRQARGSGVSKSSAGVADLIAGCIPARERATSRIHPATRSFQGLRIAINDELGALDRALPEAFRRLAGGGVLAVISFHSLEDRPVKRYFRALCGQPQDAGDSTPQDLRHAVAAPLSRRPIEAQPDEIADNPRSRSAKLRAVRKL